MILTNVTNYTEVLRSPARKIPKSGLVSMSGGRLFQSLAVRKKNKYISGLIREKGMVNLCLNNGCMSWGRRSLTRL